MPKRPQIMTPHDPPDQERFRSVWAATPASIVVGRASPSRDEGHDLSTTPYHILQWGPAGQEYAPTEHREFPGMIAKLHRGTDKDIVTFASTYGPLGHHRLVGIEDAVGGDPIPWVLMHSRTLDFVLRAVSMLSGNEPEDYDSLLPLLTPAPDDVLFHKSGVKWIAPGTKQHPIFPQARNGLELARLTNTAPHVSWRITVGCRGYIEAHHWMFGGPRRKTADMIRMVVRDIVNTNISKIVHALAPENKNHDGLAMQFSSLIEVAYWLVAKTMSGGRVTKCAEPRCGAVFIQEDARQRFCPPTGPQQHESQCAIRARVAEHRRKQKEASSQPGVSDGTKRR